MRKRISNITVRRIAAASAALLAAAVPALTGTVFAGQAMAVSSTTKATPSWHIVKRVPSGDASFNTIVAVGRNGGWAFDGTFPATAWQRNGSSWAKVSFPAHSDEDVVAAAASSASNVWAFTSDLNGSRALRWNGHAWSAVKSFPHQVTGALVISPSNVWAFGASGVRGDNLGTWHFDGRKWSRTAGGDGLVGGSALSPSDIWAVGGTSVAHWNGHSWALTSVKNLLPAKQKFNFPSVTGIYAQSRSSVYATGSGNLMDEGGPTVLLHFNGHTWTKVAGGNFGFGTQPLQQIAPDGHGGLWLPMPSGNSQMSFMLHYAGGHLTEAPLPFPASEIDVEAVSAIPGTSAALAAGSAIGPHNGPVVAIIMTFGT